MARAKSKASTTTARKATSGGKVANKSKVVKKLKPAAKKAAAKPSPKKAVAPKKLVKPPKAAPKSAKPAPKKVTKAAKPVKKASAAPKKAVPVRKKVAPAPKKVAASAPKKVLKKLAPVSKPAPPVAKAQKATAKPVKAVQPAVKTAPAPAVKAAAAPRLASPKAPKVRRTRRGPRVTPTSAPLATWISQEGSRPSSFLPAPPRAKSAFTVAAAPASSDRLIREEDLAPPKPIKTVPILVHVEQNAGRIYVHCYPQTVTLTPGAAVEWDFRYFGGVDVMVDHVVVEIGKPSPFGKPQYKSTKPGSARPHRQMSDLVSAKSVGTTVDYTIHAVNANRTELASGKATMEITR
ncbi:MAG: hypothetical protein WC538_11150 [Thermoanaerobaculia bacterium]|jgi:hypothetical protein